MTSCDNCGAPAWEHEGVEMAQGGAGPFDMPIVVVPWAPSALEKIRAKWDPDYIAQPPKPAPPLEPVPFNEVSLRQAIVDTWGPAGAHVDVFDSMLQRLAEAQGGT